MGPVAAAVAWVAGVVKTIGALKIVIGGFRIMIGQALLHAAGAMVISAIARALSPMPEFDAGSASDQGYNISVKFDPAFPRQIVVGRAAVGGSAVYAQVSGTDNKYLWRVTALSDCESAGVHAILFGGETLEFDGDVTTGWRTCTSHFLDPEGDVQQKLRVRVYLGTQTQTADADLIAATGGEWTSNCRGLGITYAIARLEFDAEAFSGGEPTLVYVLDGASAYDPRDASTGWTQNAALLAAQFAAGWENNGVRVIGLGASTTDLPEAAIEDAADICGEQVALSAGGTHDRYQANGVISSYDTPRSVLGDFALAMGGLHVDSGGEIKFIAGKAQTPVHALGRAITDDDLLEDEDMAWEPDRPGDELCNTIHSTYVSPETWREESLPIRKDAAAITEDGARFVKNRSYRFVTDNVQGQRLNKMALANTRYQGRAQIAVGLWGLAYEPGDWEEWTSAAFGGATKTFWIESVNFEVNNGYDGEPRARVILSLVETHASVDDWTTSDEDQLTGAYPAQVPLSLTMNALTVTAAVISAGGATVPQIRVSWTALSSSIASSIEFEYRIESDTIIYRGAAGPRDTSAAFTQGIMPGRLYQVRARVRAVDRVGSWTAWTNASGYTASMLLEQPLVAESFSPGRIGGNGDFVFYLDKTDTTTVNAGEIYITASRFNHPDGTQRTAGLSGTVLTQYGDGVSVSGRFYLIYTATAKATRFPTLVTPGMGTATNIFAARPKDGGGWEAISNDGTVADVTIASTDCILAMIEADTVGGGLTGIFPYVAGAAGIDGDDGTNAAQVSIFQRAASAPTLPSATVTYTFATGAMSGLNNGWQTTIPSGDDPLWVSQAQAASINATDNIAAGEWSTPAELANNGEYVDIRFKRSVSQPATPTGNDPSDWKNGVPSGTDTLWASTGRKTFAGTLIDDWSTPERISGLTPRGAYVSGNTYYVGDWVTYNGGSYVCVANGTTGQAPSGTAQANTYWDVLAAPGEPGAPGTPPSGFTATIDLSTTTGTVNLRTLADANGYTGASDATVTFEVESAVTITGLAGAPNGGVAIDTGTWPDVDYTIDLDLRIKSGGIVRGGGGRGGDGADGTNTNAPGDPGGSGGDAIYCRTDIDIVVDAGGTLQGGGGGGGGGQSFRLSGATTYGGGGGGGGAPNGPGGTGGNSSGSGSDGNDGSPGTTSGGGAYGDGPNSADRGGNGGGYGAAGSNGVDSGTNGGAAGYAVRKNGNTVNVTNNGTLTGTAA